MRRIILGCGPALAIYAWLVIASYAYCRLTRRPEMFLFPYGQWLEVAPLWLTNWAVTLYFLTSGAIATAIAAVIALPVWLVWRWRQDRRALYGSSRFASRGDMRRGGLRLTRRLF